MIQLRCAEIWGGTSARESDVETPGVHATVHSSASGDARGGDIYYFSVCSYDQLTRIALADVRGHGEAVNHLSSWLYDVLADRMNDPDGAAVLTDLNGIVKQRGFEAITTAVVATLHRDKGQLTYSYAGHPPLLLGKEETGWTALEVNTGSGPSNLPLGVLAGATYTQGTARVEPGDRLFIYSDGVSECPGPADELYGDERLCEALDRTRPLPLADARHAIRQDLMHYSGGALAHDDCTFLAVDMRPPVPFWKRRILPGRSKLRNA